MGTGYRYFITGQAWADYDRDGWLDLYITDQRGPNTLYRNRRDGTFHVSPHSSDVAVADEASGGAVFGDYDNDGWSDLYVTGYGPDHLFHNERGKGFTDVTADAGITDGGRGTTASWGDYDGDGYLDLYVANYGCGQCDAPSRTDGDGDRLFHNEGSGRFSDATAVLRSAATESFGFVGGWLDYDNDHDLDLYLVNDVRGTRYLPGNALFRNDGSGCGSWCFTDVSDRTGTNVKVDGMGLAVGDYNDDQRLDMFVTNTGWAHSPLTGPSVLLAAKADGFEESAQDARADVDAVTWGTAFLDYDNDGRRDLFVAGGLDSEDLSAQAKLDRLLRNKGDGTFQDTSAMSGSSYTDDTLGVATADFNNDGWVDLITGNIDEGYSLYANSASAGAANNRLSVRLHGSGPVNRDAVGTRVWVSTTDGRTQMQEVMSGSSLGAGNDLALHFGLGRQSVAQIRVLWPDGRKELLEDISPNVLVTLTHRRKPVVTALRSPDVAAVPASSVETRADIRAGGWVIPALVLITTAGLAGGLETRRRRNAALARRIFLAVFMYGVSFQVVHFGEHVLQLAHWAERPGEQPWITPWGRVATDAFAQLAAHNGGRATGTELLHLAGNWIFLVGLIAGYLALRTSRPPQRRPRSLAIAFWPQLVHVVEHISLTTTWILLTTPIGLSTGFGLTFRLEGAWASSIRIWWHFLVDLVVTVAAVIAVVRLHRSGWVRSAMKPQPLRASPNTSLRAGESSRALRLADETDTARSLPRAGEAPGRIATGAGASGEPARMP